MISLAGPRSSGRSLSSEGGATAPGGGKTPSRQGPLALTILVVVVLAGTGTVWAESWTLLWEEDFTIVTDWTIEAHQTASSGKLNFNTPTAPDTSTWWGPNYRTVAGSAWNPVVNKAINFTIDNFRFGDLGAAGGINRQVAWIFEDGGSRSTPDAGGAGNWFQLKVINANCCAVQAWNVQVKDNGVITVNTDYPIGFNPQGMDIDANVTINVQAQRYWINWTIGGGSGSNTGTWPSSPDGPFESASVEMAMWGYSNTVTTSTDPWQEQHDYLALTVSVPDPPPPPAPPPPRERIHADFGYSITSFGTQFYDRSNGPGKMVQWAWSFGDGYGSRREHPFHAFMCRGNYTVSLEVVDEYGNQGSVTAQVFQDETKSLCGILTRGEEGLRINASGTVISLPTGLFIVLAALSGGTLLMGIEIPFVPRSLRLLLLFLSAVGLALTLGAFGTVATWFGGG